MPSFTEIRKGLAGNIGLFFGHGVNGDTGAAQKSVELAAAAVLGLRLDDDRDLDEGRRRNTA